MVVRNNGVSVLKLAVVSAVAVGLVGCQSFREATGAAKVQPDEFAVMTKAPLIIPPDFNLRPPMPGAPDRNLGAPADQARAALFPGDAAAAAAALGAEYSDGEKTLLAKSGGATADPTIRRALAAQTGLADEGQGFANSVLFPNAAPPAGANPPAPAPAAPQVPGTTQ